VKPVATHPSGHLVAMVHRQIWYTGTLTYQVIVVPQLVQKDPVMVTIVNGRQCHPRLLPTAQAISGSMLIRKSAQTAQTAKIPLTTNRVAKTKHQEVLPRFSGLQSGWALRLSASSVLLHGYVCKGAAIVASLPRLAVVKNWQVVSEHSSKAASAWLQAHDCINMTFGLDSRKLASQGFGTAKTSVMVSLVDWQESEQKLKPCLQKSSVFQSGTSVYSRSSQICRLYCKQAQRAQLP